MNRKQLVKSLSTELEVSQKLAKEVLDTVLDLIVEGVVKNGEVRLHGFGTFKASPRKAREGVNPQNPSQKITIPAMKVATFKASGAFKEQVKDS
jgi:nucleoid DNA-binding protein